MNVTKQTLLIIFVASLAIFLNFLTFITALPEMFKTTQDEARDFSAYYIGAWRLIHNPTAIYYGGTQPGDYPIYPKPKAYKYLPSFLLVILPFLLLPYNTAMLLFNIIQFSLLPVKGYLIYKLLDKKKVSTISIVLFIALFQPLPHLNPFNGELKLVSGLFPHPNFPFLFLSNSYYWNYVDGNSKVFLTFLLISALYFGKIRKVFLSGLIFGFALFDPRFAIITLPLILYFNKAKILTFLAGTVISFSITNIPLFLYQDIGIQFLRATLNYGIVTPLYAYAWIPLFTILATSLAYIKELKDFIVDLLKSINIKIKLR